MKLEKLILLLLIIGAILSLYLTYLHYKSEEGLNTSICNIDDYLSCTTVNKSPYSVFLGIPVAILGFIGLTALSFLILHKPKHYEILMFFLSMTSFIFMTYLFIIEIFIIKALCIFCLAIYFIVILTFIHSLIHGRKQSFEFLKKYIWN